MFVFIRVLCRILFATLIPMFAVACDSDTSARVEPAFTPSSKNDYIKVVFEDHRVFEVEIDYEQPPDELVNELVQAGKFNDVTPEIEGLDIPIQGSGKVTVELELVQFDKIMTSEQVLAELGKRGFYPARYEHLLALFAKFSDLDLGDTNTERRSKFPIVAPGSLVYGVDGVQWMPVVALNITSLVLTAQPETSGWRGVSFLVVTSQVRTTTSSP